MSSKTINADLSNPEFTGYLTKQSNMCGTLIIDRYLAEVMEKEIFYPKRR